MDDGKKFLFLFVERPGELLVVLLYFLWRGISLLCFFVESITDLFFDIFEPYERCFFNVR